MKKGAKAELMVTPDFSPADGPKVALKCMVELVSWFDVEDVTDAKDKGVLMTKIVESADDKDYKMPKDMGVAKIVYKILKADGCAALHRNRF